MNTEEDVRGRVNFDSYPLCITHDSRDTNRDGMCIVYGTATKPMRERMDRCLFQEDE